MSQLFFSGGRSDDPGTKVILADAHELDFTDKTASSLILNLSLGSSGVRLLGSNSRESPCRTGA